MATTMNSGQMLVFLRQSNRRHGALPSRSLFPQSRFSSLNTFPPLSISLSKNISSISYPKFVPHCIESSDLGESSSSLVPVDADGDESGNTSFWSSIISFIKRVRVRSEFSESRFTLLLAVFFFCFSYKFSIVLLVVTLYTKFRSSYNMSKDIVAASKDIFLVEDSNPTKEKPREMRIMIKELAVQSEDRNKRIISGLERLESMVGKCKLGQMSITCQKLNTRNLLRIAIFNISYIRGLFPEEYFCDKYVPAIDMKIKKLMPMDAESRRLIDWIEEGVYDALKKKYLRTIMFSVCEAIEGSMIEEYAFSFSYLNSDSQEVSVNVNRIGNKKQGGTFSYSSTEITPKQMRRSACKMVCTLIQLMRTLDKMPEERTILMKLLYYDDVTPVDYEPPFFRGCSQEEAHNPWSKIPLKMEVGNVNSKHFVMALKVKSVLDPCGDGNDDVQDDNVSLGADSIQRDEHSVSDSEFTQSEDEYIVAPVDKDHAAEDVTMFDNDYTQDAAEEGQQLGQVKDWITTYHLSTIELSDVHSNFADLSWVSIEEIMDSLVKDGIITKTGTDCYTINKPEDVDARANGNANHRNEFDNVICSRTTQEKHSRKESMVKEPIFQYIKGQKS